MTLYFLIILCLIILTVLFSGESNITPLTPIVEVLIRPTTHTSCVFSKGLQMVKDN